MKNFFSLQTNQKKLSKIKLSLTGVAFFFLSACGSTSLGPQRYDVGVGDLTLPPNLNQLNPSQRFRLPDQVISPVASIENLALSPNSQMGDEIAWIERLSNFSSLSGSYRLVLRQAPNDLWQRLEIFVKQKTNSEIMSQANLGLIDSPWIAQSQSGAASRWLRYRVRLESVGQRAELYLTVQAIDASGRFQVDTDESISALRSLSDVLFNESDKVDIKSVEIPALTNLETKASSATTQAATIEQLIHNESFNRTWRKVELALLRGAFTIEKKNEKEGYFLIRYIDPTLIANNKDNPDLLKQLFSPDGNGIRMKLKLTNPNKNAEQTVISITDEKDQATVSLQWVREVLENVRILLQ